MSAISVVWSRAPQPSAQQLLQSTLAALSPYGTAGPFSWNDNHIALGCILSDFLPEDSFDSQPVWAPDASACLVADVRLDNRPELTRALGLVHPEQLSDSHVLMAAWLRWGEECLDHILGGFAFAVWTPARQELFAARDHTGDRPLFFYRGKDFFALASMPKGLLALPGVFRGFEESRIVEWFGILRPDAGKTMFSGVERLPFGSMLRVTPDGCECRRYWHPASAAPVRYKRDEEYAEALVEVLDRATEARLRATKAVGSQLSGGLDSSSVTASAARLLAAQGKSLTAFTSVPRPEFNRIVRSCDFADEGPFAADVAGLYPNITHILVDSTGSDLVPTIKRWTDIWDEPAFNVINALWFTAILRRATERGINVILEGAGGNGTISFETQAVFADYFRQGKWFKLAKTAYRLRKNGGTSVHAATRIALGDLLPAWAHRMLIPKAELKTSYSPLAHPDLIRRHSLDQKIFDLMHGNGPSHLAEDQTIFLERSDMGPVHASINALANIDFRDPTSDKRVYDFCYGIPAEQYLVGGQSRSLVRRAMKGRLPDATLQRYTRGFQGADWYITMQECLPALKHEVHLQQQSPEASRILDLPKMMNYLDNWPTSDYHTNEVALKWHATLTRAISMGYFLRSHDPAARNSSSAAAPAAPGTPLPDALPTIPT